MAEQEIQIDALIIDWQIDAQFDLSAIANKLLVLPWGGGDAPREAVEMKPLGISLSEIRKLHANLGEFLALADRSPGTPTGAH